MDWSSLFGFIHSCRTLLEAFSKTNDWLMKTGSQVQVIFFLNLIQKYPLLLLKKEIQHICSDPNHLQVSFSSLKWFLPHSLPTERKSERYVQSQKEPGVIQNPFSSWIVHSRSCFSIWLSDVMIFVVSLPATMVTLHCKGQNQSNQSSS